MSGPIGSAVGAAVWGGIQAIGTYDCFTSTRDSMRVLKDAELAHLTDHSPVWELGGAYAVTEPSCPYALCDS